MTGRELDRHLGLEGIQVVHPGLLRIVVADDQVLAIEREGHLRGRCRSLQSGDLLVSGAVEDQHLIAILHHHVEAIAQRIGQDIGQRSRNVEERAALIGVAVVDQQTDWRRDVNRALRAEVQRYGRSAVLVLVVSGIDADLNGSGRAAG